MISSFLDIFAARLSTKERTTDTESSRSYSLFFFLFLCSSFSYFVKRRRLCVHDIYVEEKIKLKQTKSCLTLIQITDNMV